jgi:hypothetical protein
MICGMAENPYRAPESLGIKASFDKLPISKPVAFALGLLVSIFIYAAFIGVMFIVGIDD